MNQVKRLAKIEKYSRDTHRETRRHTQRQRETERETEIQRERERVCGEESKGGGGGQISIYRLQDEGPGCVAQS